MKNLQPHQQRVVVEKEELDEKISKLTPFLESGIFQAVDSEEQERLRNQLSVMNSYSQILGERIDHF